MNMTARSSLTLRLMAAAALAAAVAGCIPLPGGLGRPAPPAPIASRDIDLAGDCRRTEEDGFREDAQLRVSNNSVQETPMNEHVKLGMSALACAAALACASAWAGETEAKKWIDNEFQPSSLPKDKQAAEMKWPLRKQRLKRRGPRSAAGSRKRSPKLPLRKLYRK